jgi:outer membrane receptor for ferric coprogen and ferric-rhodotorulic acid
MKITATGPCSAQPSRRQRRPGRAAAGWPLRRHRYAEIPAQSLDSALAAFSAVTRVQVLVPGEFTQGLVRRA